MWPTSPFIWLREGPMGHPTRSQMMPPLKGFMGPWCGCCGWLWVGYVGVCRCACVGQKWSQKCPLKCPLVPYIRKSGPFLPIFEQFYYQKVGLSVEKVVGCESGLKCWLWKVDVESVLKKCPLLPFIRFYGPFLSIFDHFLVVKVCFVRALVVRDDAAQSHLRPI